MIERYRKYIWLVVEPTPLKNMISSIEMITFPIYANIKNVPNHQPEDIFMVYING